MTTWYSSYEENNYGDLFYSLVRIYRPKKIVELGTKAGYSAYHMARALRDNGTGTLDCYDLFEDFIKYYGSPSTSQEAAEENLLEFKDLIKLTKANALSVHKNYKAVDILHIDLENNERVLEKVVPLWLNKVRKLIILEGGSRARDELDLSQDSVKMPAQEWFATLNKEGKKSLEKIKPPRTTNKGQYVVLGGSTIYKNSHINDWVKKFSQRKSLDYFTFSPFPSLTLLQKK